MYIYIEEGRTKKGEESGEGVGEREQQRRKNQGLHMYLDTKRYEWKDTKKWVRRDIQVHA